MPHPFVPKVNLKNDGSVEVVVEIVHIDAGHWADVSGCVIQEATAPGTESPAINVFAPLLRHPGGPRRSIRRQRSYRDGKRPGPEPEPGSRRQGHCAGDGGAYRPTTLGAASAERLPGITATWEVLPENPGPSGGPNPWNGR